MVGEEWKADHFSFTQRSLECAQIWNGILAVSEHLVTLLLFHPVFSSLCLKLRRHHPLGEKINGYGHIQIVFLIYTANKAKREHSFDTNMNF